MASQHHGKFTWGVGPEKVTVAGNFNNWSDTATPLHKQADGSFAADVPLPWGEKQPFKYVVDGEWKVREDEAKEWDAAGNMNNVYTAPHAPESSASTTGVAAAPVAAASSEPASAKAVAPAEEPAPAPVIPGASAPGGAPAITAEPTKPDTLVAAAVPSAGVPSAAGGSEPALGNTRDASKSVANDGPVPALAAPITVGVPAAPHASEPALGNTHHITAPDADPSSATPGHTAPVVNKPAPEAIEAVAANANIGQEATEEEKAMFARAQEYAAGAATTLTSVLGQAAHAVEDATGLHITQGSPMTVEEARAKGIDVDQLEKRELPTDTVSPVGQAPPADAVAALEEKTQALKVNDGTAATSLNKDQAAVPLPGGSAPKSMKTPDTGLPPPAPKEDHLQHDLPAQNETGENHTHIPMPAIKAIADRDPAKDRTIDAPSAPDTAGTKPISTDPSIDAAKAKKDAERNPALTGSTFQEAKTSAKTNLAEGAHRPDAPEANFDAPPPAKKDIAPGEATPAPTPVSKDAAPSTPAKTANGGSASAASTPASTPAKSAHTRESTSGSDVKKRKSGFFHKFKSAFSPKDKEKK